MLRYMSSNDNIHLYVDTVYIHGSVKLQTRADLTRILQAEMYCTDLNRLPKAETNSKPLTGSASSDVC